MLDKMKHRKTFLRSLGHFQGFVAGAHIYQLKTNYNMIVCADPDKYTATRVRNTANLAFGPVIPHPLYFI